MDVKAELPQITNCLISPEIARKLREGDMSRVWIPITAAEMIWRDAEAQETSQIEEERYMPPMPRKTYHVNGRLVSREKAIPVTLAHTVFDVTEDA